MCVDDRRDVRADDVAGDPLHGDLGRRRQRAEARHPRRAPAVAVEHLQRVHRPGGGPRRSARDGRGAGGPRAPRPARARARCARRRSASTCSASSSSALPSSRKPLQALAELVDDQVADGASSLGLGGRRAAVIGHGGQATVWVPWSPSRRSRRRGCGCGPRRWTTCRPSSRSPARRTSARGGASRTRTTLREAIEQPEDAVVLVIEVDGAPAGVPQVAEEPDPMYRRAGLDIFVGRRWTGRGIGREAITAAVRHLFERARPPPHHDRPGGRERARDPLLRGRRLRACRRHAPVRARRRRHLARRPAARAAARPLERLARRSGAQRAVETLGRVLDGAVDGRVRPDAVDRVLGRCTWT